MAMLSNLKYFAGIDHVGAVFIFQNQAPLFVETTRFSSDRTIGGLSLHLLAQQSIGQLPILDRGRQSVEAPVLDIGFKLLKIRSVQLRAVC